MSAFDADSRVAAGPDGTFAAALTDRTPGAASIRTSVIRRGRTTAFGEAALVQDGKEVVRVYINTSVQLSAKQGADDLAAYSVATGARRRVIRAGWKALVQEMSTDPAVTHALFWDVHSDPVEMSLATGKLTKLSVHLPRHALVDDAAW